MLICIFYYLILRHKNAALHSSSQSNDSQINECRYLLQNTPSRKRYLVKKILRFLVYKHKVSSQIVTHF